MNRYAVYNENGGYMFEVHADDELSALEHGKANNPQATSVKLISEISKGD